MKVDAISQEVDELLEGIKSIPSIPVVIEHIMTLINSESSDAAALAAAIENDAGLRLRVLRTANSAFFLGKRSQIDSLSQAVVVLGSSQITHFAMSFGLQQQIDNLSVWNIIDSNRYWRHSLAVASTAKMLATSTGHSTENAFTAGLLHEMGKCALASCMPKQYHHALMDATRSVTQAETHYCGVSHVVAGEQLGRYWRLPDYLISAIRAPVETDSADSLSSLVCCANALAIAAGYYEVGENAEDDNAQSIDAFCAESTISRDEIDKILNALPETVATIEQIFM